MPVLQKEEKQPFFHQRRRMLFTAIISIILLVSIILTGLLLDKESIATNLIERNVSPSWSHLFGTDWLGRDMFARTMMGLSLSIGVGLAGAIGSVIIALVLGMIASTGKMADRDRKSTRLNSSHVAISYAV